MESLLSRGGMCVERTVRNEFNKRRVIVRLPPILIFDEEQIVGRQVENRFHIFDVDALVCKVESFGHFLGFSPFFSD